MSYSSNDARRQLLEAVAGASHQLAVALACLGEAYEALDEDSGDRLEREMFRPLQAAYARIKRTYADFGHRHGLPVRELHAASPGTNTGDVRVYIERAVEATELADHSIGELQDSLLPVEVGDTELRAGLSETRSLVAEVPARGRQLVRGVGR